jgi:hypothetical protein
MRILATVISTAAALIVLSGCAYDRNDRYGYGRDGYRDGYRYNNNDRIDDRNRNDRDRFDNRDRDDNRDGDRDRN